MYLKLINVKMVWQSRWYYGNVEAVQVVLLLCVTIQIVVLFIACVVMRFWEIVQMQLT